MISSSGDLSLETLMERYQQGRETETAALIERLSPDLFRFFLAQQATRQEAHDLLQEAWLRIHRSRHTYRSGAPLLPWVFAIARCVRIDGFRRTSRISRNEQVSEQLPEMAAAPDRPATPPLDLRHALSQLPEGQREVVTLLKVNGLSLEEASRATGLTVGAVKQKASRAYATLRRQHEKEGKR